MSSKKYMAVYGTLKQGYGNHRLITDAKMELYGKAKTASKEFLMLASGVPFVHNPIPTEFGETINVEIYSFDTYEQIKRIDGLEGHPDWYRRTPFDFQMEDGELLTAEMYVIPTEEKEVTELLAHPHRTTRDIVREEDGRIVTWSRQC